LGPSLCPTMARDYGVSYPPPMHCWPPGLRPPIRNGLLASSAALTKPTKHKWINDNFLFSRLEDY
jgi:hypothetical protein